MIEIARTISAPMEATAATQTSESKNISILNTLVRGA
jgi:hypothetical protein